MNVAELLIRQGAITEFICGHGDSKFCCASRQLVKFQEEVEEITDTLLGAQVEQRRVQEYELSRDMAEVSHQVQSRDKESESDKLFIIAQQQ